MKGPMINNQYTQFRMAELSYWKHPKDQWEPLMDRIKEAGFNGIYTSACWARHEKQAGAWDFQTGNLDLAGWLQLTQAKGLYVYFAAGPWIDGEAGGCLPAWLASGAKSTPSPVADGKMALRVTDADYQTATNTWFDQLNAIAAQFQITSVPQGPIVFYQLESNYDAFYFLKEAEGRVLQEMLGAPMTPLNIGLYMAHLRDTVQADGITAPKVVALTGDFENGGRFLSGTGDTPGVYPAFTMTTDDTYQPVEQKLWTMRKEMRRTELHGQLYMAVPGIAVGVIPSAPQMARLLMAGADVVVVKDFVATLLPPDCAAVGSDYSGINFLKELDHARVSLGTIRRDVASPIALSGLPRPSYYAFKQLNYFLDTFGSGFAGKDLPYRTGPNITESVLKVKLSNPDTGALEDKW
jgi:hypothetical protein